MDIHQTLQEHNSRGAGEGPKAAISRVVESSARCGLESSAEGKLGRMLVSLDACLVPIAKLTLSWRLAAIWWFHFAPTPTQLQVAFFTPMGFLFYKEQRML